MPMVETKIMFQSKKAKFVEVKPNLITLEGDFEYLFFTTPTSDLSLELGKFKTVTVLGKDLKVVEAYGEKEIHGDVLFIIVCYENCCKTYLLTPNYINLLANSCKQCSNDDNEWYEYFMGFYPPLSI